jgi:hypothetical protein
MKPSVAATLAAALLATAPAFAAHFQTFRFSLAPGGSKPVSMPETLTPSAPRWAYPSPAAASPSTAT